MGIRKKMCDRAIVYRSNTPNPQIIRTGDWFMLGKSFRNWWTFCCWIHWMNYRIWCDLPSFPNAINFSTTNHVQNTATTSSDGGNEKTTEHEAFNHSIIEHHAWELSTNNDYVVCVLSHDTYLNWRLQM